MALKARFPIGRAAYVEGGVDSDGYSYPPTWGPIQPVYVYGWQPLASTMPLGAELTRRIITSRLLLVPEPEAWRPTDKVWLSGTVNEGLNLFTPTDEADHYLVTEDVRDCNTGPFGYRPGAAVVIQSVKG